MHDARPRDAPVRIRASACRALVAGTAVGLALGFVACGDPRENPAPTGPLAETLADVGGGGGGGGSTLGVGWTEPRLVAKVRGGSELIADALGPNAGTVVEAAPMLRRRFGLDPLSAERLVSVGGSYAFGLRLDGVDGRVLSRALTRAGGRLRRTGRVVLADVGDYAVVPEPLLDAGVLGLGARDAFGPDLTVLAISDMARAALLGHGDRLIEETTYRAAADCLGDVVAARVVPDGLLPLRLEVDRVITSELGVDLVAAGVRADRREILCVIGGTPERAEQVAKALGSSLAPDAREPGTHESIADSLSAIEISSAPYEGVEVVRAALTVAAGRSPGFVIGTISTGSVVELIGGRSR